MKLSKFNKLCKEWEINPSAMRVKLKEITLTDDLKDVNKNIFICCLYINAPDLFYCRDAEDETVEYQNIELVKKLAKATTKMSQKADEIIEARL